MLPFRRADAGTVRPGDRDITGLILCAEQYGRRMTCCSCT